MVQLVTMPKLGLTMTSATIALWLKKVGDPVKAGEALLEIETDKITAPVESPADGILLKILAEEWEERDITVPLCVIGAPGDRWEDAMPAAQPPQEPQQQAQQAMEQVPQVLQADKRVIISPIAKRLAEENGVDTAAVFGSGVDGRIEKKDIEKLLEDRTAALSGSQAAGQTAAAHGLPQVSRRVPLDSLRKVVAERLAANKREVPHVYFKVTVDASFILAIKESVSKAAAALAGTKTSLNDIIVKAVATALSEFPDFNASLQGEEIIYYQDVNIGIAVDTPRGLVVPVVRNADGKSLMEISAAALDLATRAKAGKLTYQDITGGTFTVSNLGAWGIDEFSAIINPPEAAILAVGRAADAPYALNGGLCIRPLMALTLSVDHRIIDGALAARFLSRLKQIIEEPSVLLA